MLGKKVLCILLVLGLSGSFAAANIVVNGDLETGALGDIPGWYWYVNTVLNTTDSSAYGSNCLEMTCGIGFSAQAIDGSFPTTGNQTLDFSVDYKTPLGFLDGGGSWAIARYWTADNVFLDQTLMNLPATNDQWQTFSMPITTHADADFVDVFMAIGFNNQSMGTARVDNVIITPEPTTLILCGLGGLLLRRRR